jgi:hypothetical protein
MRKPPVPRAVLHRDSRGRRLGAVGCGALAAAETLRVATATTHVAYLAVLLGLGALAAAAAGIQLLLIDDVISWLCAVAVVIVLGACEIVLRTVGFPGVTTSTFDLLGTAALTASVIVVAAAAAQWRTARTVVTRQELLRTPPRERHVAPTQQGMARARRAQRGRARPAA